MVILHSGGKTPFLPKLYLEKMALCGSYEGTVNGTIRGRPEYRQALAVQLGWPFHDQVRTACLWCR